ncbi:hypothetical protein DSO57_1000588 [Entomophthora muscae]|uniref:Uncharacterized protein n=1 Tax=Entomophthora muscae TaxID=34485 RepID=A0ACC2S045_9FUNG|nr:hypothetical protein DSO57_1000588 [Entomophthora muscae]
MPYLLQFAATVLVAVLMGAKFSPHRNLAHFPAVPLLWTVLAMIKKLPFDDVLEYTTQISLVHKYKIVRAYFHGQWTLMVGCPLLAQDIYLDTKTFPKLVPEENLPETVFAKLTGRSAFFSNDKAWRTHRKTLLDLTTFTTYVSKESTLSSTRLAELMTNMHAKITSHNTSKLDALKLMQSITFDILTAQFLNTNFNLTQSNNNPAACILNTFDNAFTYAFTLTTTLFPSLQHKHNPLYNKIYKDIQHWEDCLKQIITSTRNLMQIEPSSTHQDLVTKMIQASKQTNYDVATADKAILYNLKMLFLPSQSLPPALGAALYFLAQDSAIQDKAYKEIKSVVGNVCSGLALTQSQMKAMPYLSAIVKETLRLYPTLCPPPKRIASKDVTLGSHFIPKGTHLMIDAFAIQRNPSLWPNPNKFDPLRFIKNPNPSIQAGYLPFAGGARRCPGSQLVLDLMTNILANILVHHTVKYPTLEAASPKSHIKLKLKAQVILIPENLELEFHPHAN